MGFLGLGGAGFLDPPEEVVEETVVAFEARRGGVGVGVASWSACGIGAPVGLFVETVRLPSHGGGTIRC